MKTTNNNTDKGDVASSKSDDQIKSSTSQVRKPKNLGENKKTKPDYRLRLL